MLSRSYETVFERTLEEAALTATDIDVPLALSGRSEVLITTVVCS